MNFLKRNRNKKKANAALLLEDSDDNPSSNAMGDSSGDNFDWIKGNTGGSDADLSSFNQQPQQQQQQSIEATTSLTKAITGTSLTEGFGGTAAGAAAANDDGFGGFGNTTSAFGVFDANNRRSLMAKKSTLAAPSSRAPNTWKPPSRLNGNDHDHDQLTSTTDGNYDNGTTFNTAAAAAFPSGAFDEIDDDDDGNAAENRDSFDVTAAASFEHQSNAAQRSKRNEAFVRQPTQASVASNGDSTASSFSQSDTPIDKIPQFSFAVDQDNNTGFAQMSFPMDFDPAATTTFSTTDKNTPPPPTTTTNNNTSSANETGKADDQVEEEEADAKYNDNNNNNNSAADKGEDVEVKTDSRGDTVKRDSSKDQANNSANEGTTSKSSRKGSKSDHNRKSGRSSKEDDNSKRGKKREGKGERKDKQQDKKDGKSRKKQDADGSEEQQQQGGGLFSSPRRTAKKLGLGSSRRSAGNDGESASPTKAGGPESPAKVEGSPTKGGGGGGEARGPTESPSKSLRSSRSTAKSDAAPAAFPKSPFRDSSANNSTATDSDDGTGVGGPSRSAGSNKPKGKLSFKSLATKMLQSARDIKAGDGGNEKEEVDLVALKKKETEEQLAKHLQKLPQHQSYAKAANQQRRGENDGEESVQQSVATVQRRRMSIDMDCPGFLLPTTEPANPAAGGGNTHVPATRRMSTNSMPVSYPTQPSRSRHPARSTPTTTTTTTASTAQSSSPTGGVYSKTSLEARRRRMQRARHDARSVGLSEGLVPLNNKPAGGTGTSGSRAGGLHESMHSRTPRGGGGGGGLHDSMHSRSPRRTTASRRFSTGGHSIMDESSHSTRRRPTSSSRRGGEDGRLGNSFSSVGGPGGSGGAAGRRRRLHAHRDNIIANDNDNDDATVAVLAAVENAAAAASKADFDDSWDHSNNNNDAFGSASPTTSPKKNPNNSNKISTPKGSRQTVIQW